MHNTQNHNVKRATCILMIKHLKYLLLLIPLLPSCVRHPDLVNFQNGQPYSYEAPAQIQNLQNPTIQTDDILKIDVHSFNEVAASPFNMEDGSRVGGGGGQNTNMLLLSGYMVDSLGNINFPVIGEVEIGGLSLEAASEKLQDEIRPYLADVVVNARYLNFRYTILGEINQPGTFSTINKRITLFEAIGAAGDLTNYANREKILLVRELNGQRVYVNLDLKNKQIFESPYFYIQQNDMIYIEPTKTKVATVQDPVFRYLSLGSATLSLITLIISLTR